MLAHIDFVALGHTIRHYRQQANMTQEVLAEKIGMSTNFVGNIERAFSKPSATTLFRISLALNITMKDLLNENTVIWRDEDEPSALRSPDTVFCNTLSDWLLLTDEEASAYNAHAPADPAALAEIGFLMFDEDFSHPSAH